jgi:MFS family permease
MDASPEPGPPAFAGFGGSGALAPSAQRLVRSLSLAVFLEWAGAGSILPLLPLWVRQHGGSDAVVGAVMAAYFAAAFVFQYGSGVLSDRLGRLPVLLGGLTVYAAGSLLFLLPVAAAFDTVFRALQGAGAGASMVAALAMISHAVPLSHRGRASGRLYGAELGGLAVGPVAGSIAGVGAMRWLFLASAVASLAAAAWVLRTRDPRSTVDATEPAGERPPADPAALPAASPRLAARALTGALVAAAVMGLTTGVYESCWSLLMTRHGASQWEIGLSWTAFALPYALLARPAGWLADRLDRRLLAVGSILWSVGFLATYPFLPGFVLLMVLGIFESLGFTLTLPACQSLLGEGTSAERHGHAQGLFAASQTGTTALSAAAAGALFSIGPWVPFVLVAACCAALSAVVVAIWRRVPGRISHAPVAAAAAQG